MKKRLLKIFILCALFLGVYGNLATQNIERSSEKVTLFTDRELYLSGENILLTGTVKAIINPSDEISKVVYIDLFDNTGRILQSEKYMLEEGFFKGVIRIPDYAQTGYGIIRAYTRIQRNYPVVQLTSSVLKIVNASHPLIYVDKPNDNAVFSVLNDGRLSFRIPVTNFPDSGKVMLKDGNTIVDSFVRIFDNGLGCSDYKVTSENNLELLLINHKDTLVYTCGSLPIYDMDLVFETSNEYINVEVNSKDMSDFNVNCTLVNIINGDQMSGRIHLKNGSGTIILNMIEDCRGIFTYNITKTSGELLRSGLTFIDDPRNAYFPEVDSSLSIDASINQELVSLSKDKVPVVLVVSKEGTMVERHSILPDYLINNPIYLSNEIEKLVLNESMMKQIEILLSLSSTEIISIINSEAVDNNFSFPEFYGQTIQGYFTDYNESEEIELFCSFIDDPDLFFTTKTNDKGQFSFVLGNKDCKGEVYIGYESKNGETQNIVINNGFDTRQPLWSSTQFIPDTSMQDLITEMYLNYQLSNLSGNIKITEHDSYNCKIPFMASNLTRYVMSDYIQLASIQELFNEVIQFVKIRKQKDGYTFVVLDNNTRIEYTDPLVILDNIYMNNIDQIITLQPSEIFKIDVINNRYLYGNSVFNGIIKITTTSGKLDNIDLPTNGIFFSYDQPKMPISFICNDAIGYQMVNTLIWQDFNDKDLEQGYSLPSIKSKFSYKIIPMEMTK